LEKANQSIEDEGRKFKQDKWENEFKPLYNRMNEAKIAFLQTVIGS